MHDHHDPRRRRRSGRGRRPMPPATAADDVRVLGRPAGGRHDPRRSPGADVVVEASRPDAVATNVAARARRRRPAPRHRDDRLDRRPARSSTGLLAGAWRGGRRRRELQPRRRALRPARRRRGRALRPGRGVRPVPRRVASPGQARPPVGHRPRPGRPDRRRAIRGWPATDDLEVVVDPGRRVAGDAPRRLRCRRRDASSCA